MTDLTFERRTTARRFARYPVRPQRPTGYRSTGGSPGPYVDFAALIAIAAAPGIVLAWLLPGALVPPALSIVSFVIAGGVALYAYCAGVDRDADGVTAWDVAGTFALIWVATGTLSGPEAVLQLFGHEKVAP